MHELGLRVCVKVTNVLILKVIREDHSLQLERLLKAVYASDENAD